MSAEERLEFMRSAMNAFELADAPDELFWRIRPDEEHAYVLCNDLFYWATGDGERLFPDELALLWKTLRDLQAIGEEHYLAELFCARKRGMRPQRPFLYGSARREHKDRLDQPLLDLFEACGPERAIGSEG